MARIGHNRWLGSVMGRVTINGTIAQFSCKQSVTKAIWDADREREQDSCPNLENLLRNHSFIKHVI